MMMKLLNILLLAALCLVNAEQSSLRAVAEEEHPDAAAWNRFLQSWSSMSQKDIVETAISTSALSTLVSYVTKADLVETLQGAGPFTVMAPTNSAFAKLPASVKTTLEENELALQYVLLYHVIPGESLSTLGNDWRGVGARGGSFKTAAQESPELETKRYRAGRVGPMVYKVNGASNSAKVLLPNVRTSNGIVHVIDEVRKLLLM